MSSYLLDLPSDFADYEWEVEAKGSYSEARLAVAGRRYRLNFYDPVRLGQEVASECDRGGVFFAPNLVVVRCVTKAGMELAAEQLVRSGLTASMTPE